MLLVQLILFILCSKCFALKDDDFSISDDDTYAFYYPLSMVSNQLAQVCLEINQDLLPVRVKVTFPNSTYDGKSCGCHTANSDFSCWHIPVPIQETETYTPSIIKLEIKNDNINIHLRGQGTVQIHPASKHVFLETDRKVYKLGDSVKVRLLALGSDLRPAKNYQIPPLRVTTPYPTAATVVIWENITITSGLAHKELQLASDAPQGVWSITGGDIYTTFNVEKYILPRFEITLDGPTTIHKGAESISYTICGKYSYGRSMKGVALLKVEGNRLRVQEPPPFSRIKELYRGCTKFELSSQDFNYNSVTNIKIIASITEEGTDQIQSKEIYVSVITEPYSYRWESIGRFYKPELPYKAKLVLTNIEVPLANAEVQICYGIPWIETLACNNFTLESDNTIECTIPPINDIRLTKDLQIEAKIFQYPSGYPLIHYLTVWLSASRNAIRIIDTQPNEKKCESILKYTVLYNSKAFSIGDNVEFKYILSSRNEIVSRGKVIDKPKKRHLRLEDYPNVIGGTRTAIPIPVDKFELEIKLDKQIYTRSKLVIYYSHNNEIISDMIDVDVETCSPNKVNAKWLKSPLYPGENGKLRIQTGPESLCSISSIDKASTFLGSSERISVRNVLNRFETYTYLDKLNCIMTNKIDKPLRKYTRYSGSGFDTYEAFRESNIGVMSNMKHIVKICEERPDILRIYAKETTGIPSPPQADFAVNNRGSEVRSFFPETWLWDLIQIDNDGQVIVDRKLPDSITDWEGNVICTSSDKGFGISNKIEIKGFKPFFVDILLPYSVKRNKEILHLPVPIFNYLNHSLPIRITLMNSNDILLVDGEDKRNFSICLSAEDSYTHNYRIKATKLGYINITVTAAADPEYVRNCASATIVRRRDVVQRSLLVEPEGYPSLILKSVLLCAKGSVGPSYIMWKINLPEKVVPDTVNGRVIINSDILGPMFQNLENILVVPTGCGEQTMATLTPNLYALKYLESNNELTRSTKQKILQNLEIGYQRMLTYVHDDGSFSAFGRNDNGGSMFLTAFVIRTFNQMKKYIFIDDNVIIKAVKWIASHQLLNGCFDPVYHVLHEMGLASSKNQTTALTSYVIISFLETSTKIDEKILSNAKECIIRDSTMDKYTLAISSYALGLLGLTKAVTERLDKLIELANNKDGAIWWTQSENSLSANVETSSYVLISLIQQDPTKNLGIASSIVRWLQSQINPRGGFYSTVDTVVGLDAISRYAALVNKQEPHAKVFIATKNENKMFEINKRNRTKIELTLASYPNEVEAKIEGEGCVALQVAVNYFVDEPIVVKDLHLKIGMKPLNQNAKCYLIELKPCVSYTGLGEINMAIVEVTMPSGYAPDQASLYELISSNVIKKFEIIRNEVVFYLTKLGSKEVCTPFKIEQNLIVENVANATVKLFDYYKPELSIFKSFKLEECEK